MDLIEIPKSWKIKKLKYIFNFGKGLPITKENLKNDGIPVINYGQIHSKDNKIASTNRSLFRYVDEMYLDCKDNLVNKNDFIFADTSEDLEGCGNNTYVDQDIKLFAGYHTIILKNKDMKDNRYLAYLFNTDFWRAQIRKKVSGIKVFSITQKILKETKVILPPDNKQEKIADLLDKKCNKIDKLKTDIEKQIAILGDYKKSLITETVTKGLNPDAEMKDSGIEWIGEIPKHWNCIKGKYILEYLQKNIKKNDKVITCFRDGEVTLRLNRREDGFTISTKEIGYQGIDIGDLVVHGMDGFAGAIGISNARGKGSPVLNVLDSKENKRYIMYYLRSMAYSNIFMALSMGIRVRSCDLSWSKLANMKYPVPPKKEQDNIADFLDDKCTKIDEIIELKRKQIAKIDEYKKSLIYEYVTGKKEVY